MRKMLVVLGLAAALGGCGGGAPSSQDLERSIQQKVSEADRLCVKHERQLGLSERRARDACNLP